MIGIETWARVSTRLPYAPTAQTREEYLRQERIAVGRICRCNSCLCCEELRKHKTKNK